jgi:hypothetical protein
MENENVFNLCPVCNKNQLKLVKHCKNVYTKTCGEFPCIKKLRENTNIKLYGHICGIHGVTQKKIIKHNLKEKYGVENVSQINWVKEKKKNTCRKNFGVDHPMQSSVVMDKSRKTLMRLYGVDNISKVPEIIEKIHKSLFEVDKDLGISKFELARLKVIEKNKEKYGVAHYVKTDDFKNKSRETHMKKYGVDNYSKTKEFQEFLINSGLKKDPATIDELEYYYKTVKNYTSKSFRKYKHILCKTFPRSNNYHLDHIYSICEGYKNKIDPKIIGSITNLQILPHTVNKQKNAQSWITIERLLELYNNLSDEDKFII